MKIRHLQFLTSGESETYFLFFFSLQAKSALTHSCSSSIRSFFCAIEGGIFKIPNHECDLLIIHSAHSDMCVACGYTTFNKKKYVQQHTLNWNLCKVMRMPFVLICLSLLIWKIISRLIQLHGDHKPFKSCKRQ